ncbi:LOW QUALITY PROTEIN: hypothetical protein QYF61_004580 [Mycteria americana]|uniref:Uncharacterized protein n=1 Tax=Mycteria americana TaxID=33587 RepID=A0AAN7MXN7_MYCAM|nr:LOW QUALITY PROTEIN: hypothetical protein QYF61_004580 [Mycteria americana]
MLAGPDPLVILYMACDSTQDDLLHQLPRHRGYANTVSCQRDKQDELVTWSLQELLLISSATVGTATSRCCLQWLTFLKVIKFVRLRNSPVNKVAGQTVPLGHCRDSADHAALPSRDRLLSVLKQSGNRKDSPLSQPTEWDETNVGKIRLEVIQRITESQDRIGWKRPLRSSSPTVNLTLPRPPLYHVPKHLIQTSFKYLQGWRLNYFPGQPVPMLDNPFSEVKFPNIQSKPPLAQLEAISSCPITCYLGEETDPHLSTTSFQVVVESDKVSPQPPFLQAKQPQFPQPLLIRLVLQTLHQLRCPSLDTLQHLNVPLAVGGPKLNTVFEVRPHQCRVQGHDHFPSAAGHAIFDTSQDAIGFLGHLGTLLAHIQLAVDQHPQVLLCLAAFQPLFPKPVALHGVVVAQPVPMLDHPFSKDIFPNIQSKLPLTQLEAISSHPMASYLGEDTDTHLTTTSFQVVVETDKVSPQPPFLHTEQSQFPQLLLMRLTLHQLRCPSLDMLQHLNVSLVVRGPKLNTVFEVRPHQCRVQGHDRFPSPAGHTISERSQDAIGFLVHLGTLLAHIQLAVDQHPQVLFCWAAFQPLFPKPVALHGVVVTQVQDSAVGLVKLHTIDPAH